MILQADVPLQVSHEINTVSFLLTAMILDKEEIKGSEADVKEELIVVMIMVTTLGMMMTTVW